MQNNIIQVILSVLPMPYTKFLWSQKFHRTATLRTSPLRNLFQLAQYLACLDIISSDKKAFDQGIMVGQ